MTAKQHSAVIRRFGKSQTLLSKVTCAHHFLLRSISLCKMPQRRENLCAGANSASQLAHPFEGAHPLWRCPGLRTERRTERELDRKLRAIAFVPGRQGVDSIKRVAQIDNCLAGS